MTQTRVRRRQFTAVPLEAFYAGGQGEPMVLLHGFTDTWCAWKPVLSVLEQHHAVFAPSLPGHYGGESFPAGVKMTITGSLDMIERQLDQQGIAKAHFVGSSLGGWASLQLAVRGRALSVVGICPAGGWDHGSPEERAVLRFFRTNDRLLRVGGPMLGAVARNPRLRRVALRDLIAHPERVSADDALAMFRGAAGCSVTKDALELAGSEHAFDDLGPIECPVRILYGTRDRIVRWPSHYGRLQRILPNADYVALVGMGHLPMWDDPQVVARRILEVTAPRAVVD
jgi:pimeloyl-ACP methyl ester carboxylesterase